jgi:hypothetical protein
MEKNLNMHLRKVLPIIHEGMMERTTYFGIGAQKILWMPGLIKKSSMKLGLTL